MATMAQMTADRRFPPIPIDELPLLYEDDEEGDLGESNPHTDSDDIIHVCLRVHPAPRREYRVFANMNFYYHPTEPTAYVSPDTMAVRPFRDVGVDVTSYRLGVDGPAPDLTVEVLSKRSAQQQDLGAKMELYAQLRVKEYVLVDVTGKFLPEYLLLKRLQPDGTFRDERDADGGVTSQLGFRLILDTDGRVRMLDAATGQPYERPDEAVRRVHELEAEIARLRSNKTKTRPRKRK